MKNSSDTIGNRTRELPGCSAVPQPTAPPSVLRVFNLKVGRILIRVIYLLRFTTCYITQLTYIYSKCWK